MSDYAAFLQRKTHRSHEGGFAPEWLPEWLFDFQRELVTRALRRGI